jgi:hypothetical protein
MGVGAVPIIAPIGHPLQEGLVMVRDTALPAFIIVSINDIARRAYEMYLERGRIDGFDREDWHRAERELKAPARYSSLSDRYRATNQA